MSLDCTYCRLTGNGGGQCQKWSMLEINEARHTLLLFIPNEVVTHYTLGVCKHIGR